MNMFANELFKPMPPQNIQHLDFLSDNVYGPFSFSHSPLFASAYALCTCVSPSQLFHTYVHRGSHTVGVHSNQACDRVALQEAHSAKPHDDRHKVTRGWLDLIPCSCASFCHAQEHYAVAPLSLPSLYIKEEINCSVALRGAAVSVRAGVQLYE